MQLTDHDLQKHLEVTRENLLWKVGELRKRSRKRRVFIAGGALLLATSGIGASFAVAQVSANQASTSVTCFQHDNLDALTATVTTDPQETGIPANRDESVALRYGCTVAFQAGLAVAGPDGAHWPKLKEINSTPDKDRLSVPPLAFCYLPSGARAGFPVERPAEGPAEVCENLGLRQILPTEDK